MSLAARIFSYGRLVRFSHTVFALPFAVMGAAIGAEGLPGPRASALILFAMVAARSAAMAMNRLADHVIDADNPRTRERELPTGRMSRGEVWAFLAVCLAGFLLACALLNPLTLRLSPIVIVVLLSYPFAKRFTSLCHLWLGAALGLSPIGAYVAVRGEFGADALGPWILGGAVLLWTAGFDIIYALLDVDFDRGKKLFSLPARFGPRRALAVSALFHVVTVGLLVVVGMTVPMRAIWFVGVAVVAGILLYEHRIVSPADLSRVNTAFFTLNGVVSLLLMAALVLDRLV
jgi:4-hydroxybenzoate polyprenyltransferase